MATFGTFGGPPPFSAPPEATPQQDPFATQFTAPAPEPEDDDEWEYEYSTTETETYYVTLDLTNPAQPPKRKPAPQTGRTSRRIRWINPVLLIKEEEEARAEKTRKKRDRRRKRRENRKYRLGSQGLEDVEYDYEHGDGDDDDDLSDSDEEEEGEGLDNDGVEGEGERESEESEHEDLEAAGFRQDSEDAIPAPDKEENGDGKELNKIQIMELHSETPMVLFRGKYYTCQWVSNIGTEMLFTKHDPNDSNPLPCLRTLQGDVDLLAASSARIMGTEVVLEPKAKGKKAQKTRRARLKVKDLAIEVGQGSRLERKEQAKFLEEFINTKQEMGEEDAVTVDARSRKSIWKWSEFFKAKNQHEMARLRRIIWKGGEAAAEAATKLLALEEEEKRREASPDLGKKQRKPRKGSGQKRKGVPGGPPKPKRGRPALGKLRKVTDTPIPTAVGTPGSGMGSMAPSSPGDFDGDDTEDSDLDDEDSEEEESEEGDSEEGDSEEDDSEQDDTEQGDIDEGDSDEGDSEDEDSDEEQSSDGELFSDSDEEGHSEEDDEDDDEDTNMYG